jgi:hypothetical protein
MTDTSQMGRRLSRRTLEGRGRGRYGARKTGGWLRSRRSSGPTSGKPRPLVEAELAALTTMRRRDHGSFAHEYSD